MDFLPSCQHPNRYRFPVVFYKTIFYEMKKVRDIQAEIEAARKEIEKFRQIQQSAQEEVIRISQEIKVDENRLERLNEKLNPGGTALPPRPDDEVSSAQ